MAIGLNIQAAVQPCPSSEGGVISYSNESIIPLSLTAGNDFAKSQPIKMGAGWWVRARTMETRRQFF